MSKNASTSHKKDNEAVVPQKEVEEVVEESSSKEESELGSDDTSEYEEIDITDNSTYQVFSAFLQTEDGENVCDLLKQLVEAVNANTKIMTKLLKKNST